jgi:hypothetical protein
VAPSTIAGAGNGLWAERDFATGELVTYYDGVLVAYFRDLPRRWRSHARGVYSMRYTLLGNYGAFARAPAGTGGAAWANAHEHPNVEFMPVDTAPNQGRALGNPFERVIALRARRAIHAGTEIFVDYGGAYWEQMEVAAQEIDTGEPDEALARRLGMRLVTPADFAPAAAAAADTAGRRRITPTLISANRAACAGCGLARTAAGLSVSGDAPHWFCHPLCLATYVADLVTGEN